MHKIQHSKTTLYVRCSYPFVILRKTHKTRTTWKTDLHEDHGIEEFYLSYSGFESRNMRM